MRQFNGRSFSKLIYVLSTYLEEQKFDLEPNISRAKPKLGEREKGRRVVYLWIRPKPNCT